jgi:type VI secretion system protein ImpB
VPGGKSYKDQKEMIVITDEVPGTGKQGKELPLVLAVVMDCAGKSDDTPIADRDLYDIDKQKFNQVMAAIDVNVDLAVPNKLAGREDEDLTIHLEFKNIKDFRPEQIAEQVPELRMLVERRKMLKEMLRRPDMSKKVNEWLEKTLK